MSHIAVDLKVIEVLAPGVARASGVSEDRILAGLLRLWHRCWSTKSVVLSRIALASVFGADGIDLVVDALVDSGFLETLPEGWRVKGSERYLRLAEARSKGGKAASANLIPGGPKTSTGPRLQPRVSRGSAEGQPSKDLGSTSALSPSTEHRAPNTEHQKEEAPPPPQPIVAVFELKRPDLETLDAWVKEDFWRAAEITRREAGFPPEKWPNPVALSRWWGEAQQVADTRALADAFVRFIADKHWRAASPPCPWAAFAKQYLNFIPPSRGVA